MRGESHSNLLNLKFGHLTPVAYVPGSKWKCLCDCGKTCIVSTSKLNSGHTKSCGCLKHQGYHFTHRLGKGRLYRIWANMKTRCYNKADPHYSRWGGRGITVCAEWVNDFQAFHDWAISHGYQDDLSIDRIDNDKGYSPENCRWATAKQQNNNKRNVKRVMP